MYYIIITGTHFYATPIAAKKGCLNANLRQPHFLFNLFFELKHGNVDLFNSLFAY